ncbi:MAG: hypothetical protein MZW92_69500 [Comamonadaceae bacterium]|nr:hypothetical protein [Comamonadaceae bacterium]
MANGSLCVVMGYSGDINIARQRAIDSKSGARDPGADPADAARRCSSTRWPSPRTPSTRRTRTCSSTTSCAPRCTPALTNKVFYANPNAGVEDVREEGSGRRTRPSSCRPRT